MTDFLTTGPMGASRTLVIAHGAGAAMDSPVMAILAEGLAAHGIRVVRFEFPYMAARREGRRPGPDREPILLQTWRDVVAELGDGPSLAIGGKSMGGRIASMVAAELQARALVCFGYPFHPPGRPERTRTAHLEHLPTPALIHQGTRDPFGNAADVATYTLSPSIRINWLQDGDHDFRPRKASGQTQRDLLTSAIEETAAFL